MYKSRHRRTRSASGVIEGSEILQKQNATYMSLNSRSYCDGNAKRDMQNMLDLGEGPSTRVIGTPIKKLLAEEMEKEGESKIRRPSIVGKLMGLEGTPSPLHVGGQQRRLSDSCQHGNGQIDLRRRRKLFDAQSSKRNSMEHQEFKDVYEDLEASHVANHRREAARFVNPDMALMLQKFMDAKRFSTDERFQNSKEFDDTLEALESNKELLLQYLQEPDSLLLKKHLQDVETPSSKCRNVRVLKPSNYHLQDIDTSSSKCRNIRVLKPSNDRKYESSAKSRTGGSCKREINLQKERLDGLLLQSRRVHSQHNFQKLSASLSERREENILPTKIVVLKPDIGIAERDITSVPYHPDARKHTQHPHASSRGEGAERKTSKSMGISGFTSKEAMEMAKEITRQIKDTLEPCPFNVGDAHFRSSGVKGYAGDESSCDVYESDSTCESDITTLSSMRSYGRDNLKKCSSLGSSESSVGREAKKRLSERWKMTQYYQDFEVAGKSSTLGEMLSLPDGCMKPEVHAKKDATKFGGRKVTAEWDFPLGISSRDGWKDVCVTDSSGYRSTSPPLGSKKHQTRGRREVHSNKQYSLPKEPLNHGQSVNHRRSRSLDGVQNLRDEFLSKHSRSSKKKLHSSRLGRDSSLKGKLTRRIDNNLQENLSEKLPLLSQVPNADGLSNPTSLDDAKTESITLSAESSVEMVPKLPSEWGNASPLNQEVSNLQAILVEPSPASHVAPEPELEPESSVSSKEADHPSPLSVLEVPFAEDISSGSECFERVSAELNGLRMQLQLLKMEREAYADVVVSDEEVEGHSAMAFEDGSSSRSQTWQSSYMLDVLTDSGVEASDPDTFMTSCHSLDCPLDPLVFDNLEKKYTNETTGPKYERRLLFDRINFGLLEILRKYVDHFPWVKPTEGINWKWQNYGMMNMLNQLMRNDENIANAYTDSAASILEEMHWLEFKDEVDLIGEEIEKMLIEELLEEVVTM